jgi:hypothetical protein
LKVFLARWIQVACQPLALFTAWVLLRYRLVVNAGENPQINAAEWI